MVDTEDHLDQENTQNVQSKHEHKDSHCSSLPQIDDTSKKETWYSLVPKLHMVCLSHAK